MPKSLFLDPASRRSAGVLQAPEIPLFAYGTPPEQDARKDRALTQTLFSDMCAIRAFEQVLKQTKEEGGYAGIPYAYHGPAHLCIGQEALSVGVAHALKGEDMAFGTHRGHGDFIARALCFAASATEEDMQRVMRAYPHTLRALERQSKSTGKALFLDFIFYGMLAEVFAKGSGFYHGLSGSMHLFLPEIGVWPNNAVVGGSAPLATGAALFKKVNERGGIALCHVGDGALGCGVVYESLNFAAMDQYRTLWGQKGGLPIVYVVADNGYGMGGQTAGETMAFGMPARLAMGVSPDAMHAERVDGMNVFAVLDAMQRKRRCALEQGPVLLDVQTYRFEGHSQSDHMSYRKEEEIEAWRRYDPISTLAQASDHAFGREEEIRAEWEAQMRRVMAWAASDTISPYFDFKTNKDYFNKVLFNNETQQASEGSRIALEGNPRLLGIARRARFGENTPVHPTFQIRDALFEAVVSAFRRYPTLVSYGEEARDWGNVSGVYEGLTEALPYPRLFNAPISEGAIVSTAVGYAMAGGRALVEMMFADFMGRAGDEILNQMAKWQAISGGKLRLPVVLRVMVGCKYGTQHSQEWTALTAHVPGLKVVYPVTPYDAKGLLLSALNGNDPVVVFESQRLYGQGEIFHKGGVPRHDYCIPIGQPALRRAGKDVTVITLGAPLYRAWRAAQTLSERGVDMELFDLRSVTPLDLEPLCRSVRKTGRVLLVSDAVEQGSILHTVASRISAQCFSDMRRPAVVLGAKYGVTPPFEYDAAYFAQAEDIAEAAMRLCRD